MLTQYLQAVVTFIGEYPTAALVIVFLISAGEALFIVGLVVPSTVVLVGAGTLIGMGKLEFMPIFLAASLGAIAGDALSYWFGHVYKEGVRLMWPFSRYVGLLDRGESFFKRHGGKSVFVGRFIPGIKSVVPGVAGILGMNPWRFTLINVVSALAWSASHLLPGMGIGRAVDVTSATNPRLLELLLVVAIIIVVAWYATKFAFLWLLPHAERWRLAAVGALAKSSRPGTTLARRVLTNEEGILVAYALGVVAAAAAVGFTTMGIELLVDPDFARSDTAISGYIQSLRTPFFDHLMIAITMLGDGVVLAALAIVVVAVVAWHRRWRLAGSVAIAFAGAALFVPTIKGLVQRARPLEIYQGADSFSFPSGHATLSATVLGITVLIAAHGVPRRTRLWIYAAGAVSIGLIGFSRLYLNVHWPSDVGAGSLFGAALIFLLAFFLHGQALARLSRHVAVAAVLALTLAYPLHLYTGFAQAEASYAAQPVRKTLAAATWLQAPWRYAPTNRVPLDGEFAEPMVLQTDLPMPEIGEALRQVGWTGQTNSQLASLIDAVLPSRAVAAERLAFPLTHYGRPPIAVYSKLLETPGSQQVVLRFWMTEFDVVSGATARPLLVAAIDAQTVRPLPFSFALPERLQMAAQQRRSEAEKAAQAIAAATGSALLQSDGRFVVPGDGATRPSDTAR